MLTSSLSGSVQYGGMRERVCVLVEGSRLVSTCLGRAYQTSGKMKGQALCRYDQEEIRDPCRATVSSIQPSFYSVKSHTIPWIVFLPRLHQMLFYLNFFDVSVSPSGSFLSLALLPPYLGPGLSLGVVCRVKSPLRLHRFDSIR